MNTFSCGKCGETFATKGEKRRQALREALRAWPVTTPVADVTDAERFPEINAAIKHARTLGEG